MQAQAAASSKLEKNEIRCYHCRLGFGKRVGDWVDWNHMQVFLCPGCQTATKNVPERSGRRF